MYVRYAVWSSIDQLIEGSFFLNIYMVGESTYKTRDAIVEARIPVQPRLMRAQGPGVLRAPFKSYITNTKPASCRYLVIVRQNHVVHICIT
jgi:hypothetical protein